MLCKNSTDSFNRIRETIQAGFDQPDNPDVFSAQADAFMEHGFVDNAIESLQKAIACADSDAPYLDMMEAALALRNQKRAALRAATEILGHHVSKCLGIGWEGAVYLALDRRGRKCIVKAFHPAFIDLINYSGLGGFYRKAVKSCRNDLLKLTTILESDNHPIYRIQLLQRDGKITGIKYRYEFLLHLNRSRIHNDEVAKPALNSFLTAQSHLLKKTELCLSDASIHDQFMMCLKGKLHYVDYGTTIIPINDFRCQEDHWQIKAFLQMLYSIYKRHDTQRIDSHGIEIALDPRYGLFQLEEKNEIIQQVLEHIKRGRLEVFLDYSFYHHLGKYLPKTINIPSRIYSISKHFYSRFYFALINRLF